ncbi:hypothetical protein [Microbacterium sp. EST19A]|uniref:hypothetical protein n=1 Tax=Microbacterium sp. EST19A TaxID=2862681 RepID=UPI001CBA6BF6|nr:hypothetical protein [Microbacterium sp. EST19A]
MKIFDLALNAIIVLSATVFLAYIGLYYFDFGLFITLPESISGIFLRNGALQYVALGLLVAALIAKPLVGRAIKRTEAETKV